MKNNQMGMRLQAIKRKKHEGVGARRSKRKEEEGLIRQGGMKKKKSRMRESLH